MKKLVLLFTILTSIQALSQNNNNIDFTAEIKKYNISELLTLEEFNIENDTIVVQRQQPLGFIGENYERLYIRFISVIKNPNNSMEYLVYGKTRVKENICPFQGKLTITTSMLFQESEIPKYKQGFVSGTYVLFEDTKQKGTGLFRGTFQTNFYITEEDVLKYDAIMWIADGYKNNQFEGSWTSYKTGKSKKCNWGDYRIPDSGNFDSGAGEFSPSRDYASYGWMNYILYHQMNQLDFEQEPQIIERENRKWWIEKK